MSWEFEMGKNYSVRDGDSITHYNSYGEKIGESHTRDGILAGTKETIHFDKHGNRAGYSLHKGVDFDPDLGVGGVITLIIMALMVVWGLFSNIHVGICVVLVVDASIVFASLYNRFPQSEIVVVAWYQFFCFVMNVFAVSVARGDGFIIFCFIVVDLATIFFALSALESAGSIAVFIILYPAILISMAGGGMPSSGTIVILMGVFIVDVIITLVSHLQNEKKGVIAHSAVGSKINNKIDSLEKWIVIRDTTVIAIAVHAELFWTIIAVKAGSKGTFPLVVSGYIICLFWAFAVTRSGFRAKSWALPLIWGVISIFFLIAVPGAQNILNRNLTLGLILTALMILGGVVLGFLLERHDRKSLTMLT